MNWTFFRDRDVYEATEVSSSNSQDDINNQLEVSLTDKEKWQRSKQRWRADINPADEAFTTTYDYFIAKLSTRSPEAVVREDFSKHEVRKFLNGYVDKKRLKAIYDQQVAEKDQYTALLESSNYKISQIRDSPLALKLTMMYFGLPVAPMTFTDPLQLSGGNLFGSSGFSAGLNEDEDPSGFEDEDLSFVPEELRPLRFLNYYDRRGHGKDNSHMSPEKTYELFYGIPMVVPTHELMNRMRLRGAGINDAPDDEELAKDDDDIFTAVARPVAEDIIVTHISPHLAIRREDGDDTIARGQIYLWGLSGRTVFSYFDAKSFFSAIDRILGLSKRSDDLTSVGITISLLSHPKGERGPCAVLASDQCFLGRSEEEELNFYRTWLETIQYFDDQLEDGNALDICVAQISQDMHFSEMQQDLVYRPSLESDRIVSFSLSNDNHGALSYLSMNFDVNRKISAVQYQEWFKSLWRTLSYPTEEELKTYSIGSNQALRPQSCLVSITCAEASEDEEYHWFFSDVGPTCEAWDCFTTAYHVNGRREFVLNAIPMTDSRAALISVPIEIASVATCTDPSAQKMPERNRHFYWGCHDQTDDVIAFQEADGPQLQTVRDRPLQLNPMGRPVNGVQLDDFAKGKAFREWSYAHPLSIHMQGQHPSIPINAPPLETILKTPGLNGLAAGSVPVMSTQVLTPTEQRHLQETVFELRSLALNRAQPCPFRPCRKHFAIDDEGRQHFRDHIQSTHIDKKCPLCDDKMFGYYDERTKQQHFYEKHVYYFSHKDDLHLNTVFEVQSKELTHERESKWNFCARCGRDHIQLNVNGDRAQHDNICFPGVTEEDARSQYCVDCGGNTSGSAKHVCSLDPTADPNTKPVHCKKCALPTHKLARSYAEKHLARCRGSHTDTAHWCPWCGQNLTIYSRTQSYKHLDECSYKPPSGEGPVNTTTGEASESPNDGRETRYWEKQFHFIRDGARNIIQVPKECSVKGCTKKNLQELHADALLDHYSSDTHSDATNRLRFCPICNIDFVRREWVKKQQKVDHFKDHIEERERRITLDLEIAQANNKLDAEILAKLNLRNEDEFVSKTKTDSQDQVDRRVLSLKLKNLERLLEEQKTTKHGIQQTAKFQRDRYDSLEKKFNTLMDAFTNTFAQDRTGKRARDSASTADDSGESSSKKQRGTTIHGPIDPRTPQILSISEDSWLTTPSTGSSVAVMMPSDDPGPPGYRGPQGRTTLVVPGTSKQQATDATMPTVPIKFDPRPPKPMTPVQYGNLTTVTRARRAQIARVGKDEQIAPEGDDHDGEGDDEEQ